MKRKIITITVILIILLITKKVYSAETRMINENLLNGTVIENEEITRENATRLLTGTKTTTVTKTWDISATSRDNVSATLYSDGTLIISGRGNMIDALFSEGVAWTNYRNSIYKVQIEPGVTSIGNFAFYKCNNMISIDMHDGIKDIGDYVFRECSSLKSITIPKEIDTINTSMFNGCTSLTSVEIPSKVEIIGIYAFNGCTSLTNVKLSYGLTIIGSSAFKGCSKLTNIEIPQSVTNIGVYAFDGCSSLENINLPYGIETIEDFTFNGCTKLTNIEILSTLKRIGKAAFQSCSNLNEINIPTGLTIIDEHAFYGCRSLKNIKIPNGVTSIANAAFYGCRNLISVDIPESLTNIGESAFNKCTSLRSIRIPMRVNNIGENAFLENTSLQNVTVYCNSYGEIYMKDHYTYNLNVEHSYNSMITSPTCNRKGYTTHTCIGCNSSYIDNYTEALEHTEIIDRAVEPTCMAEGKTEGKHCLVCGEIIIAQEIIPELPHEYETKIIKPTCTVQGHTSYTCKICKGSYIDTYVDALGHTEVKDEAIEPTCGKTGKTEGKHCLICGEIIIAQKEIPKLVHANKSEITKPTCTVQGYTTHNCTICKESYVDTYVDALGHNYGEWIIDKKATYEETGHKYRVCLNCKEDKQEEVIPRLLEIATKYTVKEKDNVKFIISSTGIKVSKMLSNITSNKSLKIVNKNGKELGENDLIGTGFKIITKEDNMEIYTVVVKGDVNGDGKIDFINDIIGFNNYRLKLIKLNVASVLAGDIDENEKIDFINDVIKINNYRIGIINNL